MSRIIDHVVIAVRELDQAVRDYTEAGFTVTPGGEHVGRGSHNALITFADGAYIELIAFKDPDTPRDFHWWRLLSRGEGLADFCLSSTNLEEDAALFRAVGVEPTGPFELGRQRPDGQQVDWRLVVPPRDDAHPPMPFFIDDDTPRESRVPGGAASQHRSAVTGTRGVVIAVEDVNSVGQAYQQLLGIEPSSVSTDGVGNSLRFTLGNQWLELIEPASPEDPVGQYLQQRGSCPYELVLYRSGGTGDLLPLERTHGARIRVAAD